jgi:PAS domain S-box-containing protein
MTQVLSSLSVQQRLALDLQSARTHLDQERERVHQLLAELDRQNAEIDQLRNSMSRASDSRLQAEEALNDTRDRLQMAVEAAGLALWEWDLISPDVRLNARWGEMIGEAAAGEYWSIEGLRERVHPEDRERVVSQFRALLQQQGLRAVAEYRLRVAHGWLWIESHGMVALRDRNGRVLRLMGTHADISERKRVEEEGRRARQLAEQTSRAKSDFLANISHEVRTPLNAIMGLTSLLMDSPLNAEQQHWLSLMNGSAHTLLALLNDVLDFSRIDAGKLQLEDISFPLGRELNGIATLYREQAAAKSIRFSLTLAPTCRCRRGGTPCACARCWATCCPMPSNSPAVAA